MINSFFGLELGRRAMDAARRSLETAGHNISNASTEGYSRQRVELGTTIPFTEPALNRPAIPGQMGTGVKIEEIKRIRDEFLDRQFRQETSVLGKWSTRSEVLRRMEMFISEPADTGLKDMLNEFWSAVEELNKRPDSLPIRENMVQQSESLGVFINELSDNFSEYRDDLNVEIKLKVEEANGFIDRIAALSGQINQITAIGDNANDLLDERDLMIDKLSKLMDISTSSTCPDAGKEFGVWLDNKLIVQGTDTRHLVLVKNAGNNGYYDVQLEDNTYDITTNTDVAQVMIEQGAREIGHDVRVNRLATETRYTVGNSRSVEQMAISDIDTALGLQGTLQIKVGNGPTKITGNVMADPILPVPTNSGTSYSFIVKAGPDDKVVEYRDEGGPQWQVYVDGAVVAPPLIHAGAVNLTDIATDLNDAGVAGGFLNASVDSTNRLVLESSNKNLVSIIDKSGALASTLGVDTAMSEDGPLVSISIAETDTLATIRNKVNAAYNSQTGFPDQPEEWLKAEAAYDSINDTYYLRLESNVVGEDYRIHVMPQSCNLLSSRLGLLDDRGVTNELVISQDASVRIDNHEYLSTVNDFRQARMFPTLENADDYSAETQDTVTDGIIYKLKGLGETSIQNHRFVSDGQIRGLLEGRDDILKNYQENIDELAYTLVTEFNALHHSGHGIGDASGMSGVDYFNPLMGSMGSSASFGVNGDIIDDPTLVAAALDDGNGFTRGDGDGELALKLAQLKQSKVLAGRSSNFNEYYESFLASVGIDGQEANLMNDSQENLTDQIASQRQSVMGVNSDEEMTDIIRFQQMFNAMARFISTVDEMLDKIINGLGAGR